MNVGRGTGRDIGVSRSLVWKPDGLITCVFWHSWPDDIAVLLCSEIVCFFKWLLFLLVMRLLVVRIYSQGWREGGREGGRESNNICILMFLYFNKIHVPSSINATVNSTVVLKCSSQCTPLWMILAHRDSHPKKESQLGKEKRIKMILTLSILLWS